MEIRHTLKLMLSTKAKLRIFRELKARLRLTFRLLAYLSFISFLEMVGLAVVGLFSAAGRGKVVAVRDIRMMLQIICDGGGSGGRKAFLRKIPWLELWISGVVDGDEILQVRQGIQNSISG